MKHKHLILQKSVRAGGNAGERRATAGKMCRPGCAARDKIVLFVHIMLM